MIKRRPAIQLHINDYLGMRHSFETTEPREAAFWLLRTIIHNGLARNLNPVNGIHAVEMYPEFIGPQADIEALLVTWEDELTPKFRDPDLEDNPDHA